MNHRKFCLSVVLFVLLMQTLSPLVSAHRFDLDMFLQTGESYEVHKTLTNGSRIVGNFSFTLALGNIYFFICNSTNFQEWSAGNVSSSSVEAYEKVHGQTHEFDFAIPYADTWYVVFSNEQLFQVTITGYVDFPDTPPFRLSFEIDEWVSPSEIFSISGVSRGYYALGTEVDAGNLISHTLEVTSGGSTIVFFCDSSNFNKFGLGDTYSTFEENYIYSFELTYSFEVPYSDTWYVVVYNPDRTENIHVSGSGYFEVASQSATYSSYTTVTEPPLPTMSGDFDSILLFGGATVAAILIAIIIARRPSSSASPPPEIYSGD